MKKHFHMIGIGGIGLSGVARILLQMGYRVSGSDPRSSDITDNLQKMGAQIYCEHKAENIEGADYIVVSSAISKNNPEAQEAERRGIPILHRAQMLGYIMKERTGIAVSGTHGKTTTSSMMANLLEYNQMDPTLVIGGQLVGLNSNAKLGKSEYMVVEADESDASFLHLDPRWTVVTNVDVDVNLNVAPYSHLNFDYDKTLRQVTDAFLEFIHRQPNNGKAILCADDNNVRKMIKDIDRPYITYGLSQDAEIRGENVSLAHFGSNFAVFAGKKHLGDLTLKVPGLHNVQNALAVVAQGLELGLDFENIAESLLNFQGVRRRFEKKGEVSNILIVDDYAHNPGKIRALLSGARTGGRDRVIAVFQPHRYTRTKFLFDEFADAFCDADVLITTEIYAAGECPIVGIKGESLAAAINSSSKRPGEVHFIPTQEEIVRYLEDIARPNDLIVTCGAGDIYRVGEILANRLPEIWSERLAAG